MNMFEELEQKYGIKHEYLFKQLFESQYWPFILEYFDSIKTNGAITLTHLDLDKQPHLGSKTQGIILGCEYLGQFVKSCVDNVSKEEEDKK